MKIMIETGFLVSIPVSRITANSARKLFKNSFKRYMDTSGSLLWDNLYFHSKMKFFCSQ